MNNLVAGGQIQQKLSEVIIKQQTEMNYAIEQIIQEELQVMEKRLKSELLEEVNDLIIKNDTKNKKELNKISNRIEGVERKAETSYQRTSTLEFTGKARELKNAIHSKVYKVNGNRDTLESKLFHGRLVNQIYGKLKDFYEVSKYGQIPEDSLGESLKMVSRWRPEENYKRKFMREFGIMKDKGTLTKSLEGFYDNYLDKTGGEF